MRVIISEIDYLVWIVKEAPDGYDDPYCVDMDEATYREYVNAIERYEEVQDILSGMAKDIETKIHRAAKKQRALSMMKEAEAMLTEVGEE